MPDMSSADRDAYYARLLQAYNEAIVLDYIVPFRVVYPPDSKD